jgi:hypothetical protein
MLLQFCGMGAKVIDELLNMCLLAGCLQQVLAVDIE